MVDDIAGGNGKQKKQGRVGGSRLTRGGKPGQTSVPKQLKRFQLGFPYLDNASTRIFRRDLVAKPILSLGESSDPSSSILSSAVCYRGYHIYHTSHLRDFQVLKLPHRLTGH